LAKLSEAQIEAIIGQQIELAKAHDKTERATARDKALDYYFGNMDKYVPPEPNRSKVVSRDVADTIGWMIPQLMRVFTASGRMFVADPVAEDDLSYADQVTDGLNYVFWKDNKGYEVVYSATWEALLHGDGIVKTFYDDTPVYGPAKFIEGLTEDQRAMALQDDRVDVLASSESTAPDGSTVYDMKVRVKTADGKVTTIVIPIEDFLIDGDAISIEDAAFKDHLQRKTRSDLVAMGYPKDKIWSIPEAARNETPEAQARRVSVTSEATDKSMELVDYHECFVMVDADGDGEAEMVRACYAGSGGVNKGSLLDWEVWEDEDPFDNIPCEPIPHRWNSRSAADKVIDIQDVKTVLTRQYLNNTYWVNNPQRFAQGKIKNPDQLENPDFGGTVFGDIGSSVTDLTVPYIGDKALAALNYMDEVAARRTGVNSQTMALDPEVLQNQSATANQNATDASRSQPELIARNMAEFGWSKVGRKILRLMNKHETQPRTILVKGKPVQIDPKTWNPDMHVNVNTGLGTGSRDRDAMMLGQVLQQQIAFTDRISVAFPDKGLDMLPYIHNTLTQFAEATGLRSPELYWPEIDPAEIEQGKQRLAEQSQQPDPKVQADMAKAQADQQLAQQKMQADAALQAQKQQADQEANAAKLAADQQKAQQDFALRREQLAAEMQLKRDQLGAELQLKREQMTAELALQRELGHANAAAKVQSASITSSVHPGGEPG